jgi:16S rRNA (guanine527-N7)-methyltransferase
MINELERKLLKDHAKALGLELTEQQLEKFNLYKKLIGEWNQKINLISRKDTSRIISYHFLDSISSVGLIPAQSMVVDLGSGAGLPGIPIKIARPDINLVLIESIKKKAVFLSHALEVLGLKESQVIAERAEKIVNLRAEVILARLVGKIKDLLKVSYHLLKKDGIIIFYKSTEVDKEISEAQKLVLKMHWELKAIKEIKLPGTELLRKLVVYTKKI